MNYSALIEQCIKIVADKQKGDCPKSLQYHNMSHTLYVLQMATQIAENTLGEEHADIETIQLAAVFHDAIYICDKTDNEQESALFAQNEMQKLEYPIDKQEQVKKLILATQWGYKPQTIPEQIIIDADLAHLQKASYIKNEFQNLFEETTQSRKLTKKQWIDECIEFLSVHQYFTTYAQKNFSKGKKDNLNELQKMKIEDKIDTPEMITEPKEKKKKKKKKAAADRGVETLFRVTLRNHTTLSQIADNKANTLISINAIIISIILSTLFPNSSSNPALIMPAIVLLTLCLITIVLAIIATVPRTTQGSLTRNDILNKKGNLAFFGNFHSMSMDEYEWGIGELIKDKDYLYKSLTRDLYYLGKVLKKKYFFLRITYFTFVANLVISISFFILSLHFNG
ncbi:Pycsar system effector family protein [Labilibacter marinus]|uniref:Pycsar system effector family protein n=1 Tax=Labilibacter marinus TaxID=1477105 RepID=UPI000B05C488|nr:Pycsar system effector family protein [Labilibacter marinus]